MILGLILLVIIICVVISCVKVVRQAQALVIERLGAYQATWGTGLHFKIPILDRVARRVDLKEQVVDFAPQPVITKDNVTMRIDTVVFYQITDPKMFCYGVANPIMAIENLTATTLRNIIGDLELDQTLTSRETINTKMRASKYVNANMMQFGHSLGGEQSGHIIFSKYAVTGDGVLTSLMLMEVMLEKKEKLSELRKGLVIYPQVLKNIRVNDKPAARADEDVIEAVKKVEQALGENGRILLRESGTEPVIRVMVEAETQELCERYVDDVIAVLKAKGHEAK